MLLKSQCLDRIKIPGYVRTQLDTGSSSKRAVSVIRDRQHSQHSVSSILKSFWIHQKPCREPDSSHRNQRIFGCTACGLCSSQLHSLIQALVLTHLLHNARV